MAARHRRELLDMAGDPPDLSRVPDAWFQKVVSETEAELAALLLLIFLASAAAHGTAEKDATASGIDWAQRQARERAAAWGTRLRDGMAQVDRDIQAARELQRPPDGAGSALSDLFSPSVVEREVITQTTVATSAGSEFAVNRAGLADQRDRWRTERDGKVCPICKPLDGTTREVWARKFPGGPPAHPRCRCEIQYHRSEMLN